MAKFHQEMVLCQVCKEQKKMSEVLSAEIIREPIVVKIMATHPDWSSKGFIIARSVFCMIKAGVAITIFQTDTNYEIASLRSQRRLLQVVTELA